MKKALLILIACPLLAYPQTRKQKKALALAEVQADTVTVMNLRAHVQYLSDDRLEGRRAGTPGELLAMQYISTAFQKAGITPKGTHDFEQEFEIAAGKQLPDTSNLLEVNGQLLSLHNDFFPLANAASLHVTGSTPPCLREKGAPWFWDVKEVLDDNKDNAHFNIYGAIRDEATKAAKKGAQALLIFNSSKQTDHIHFNKRDTTAVLPLPVLYITAAGVEKYFADLMATYALRIQVEIQSPSRTGRNVVGYIDNKAATTIILGAHYDHLGYGEDGNSLDGQGQIHHGADDNASGTAALIELARLLKASNDKNNNYLFIAFSGEELGLLGSKYWLEHPSFSILPNYMINMDMIGRYNSAKPLTIGGYGSSPAWASVLQNIPDHTLATRFDSSGAGPSDHASFYRKNIPVLFFFTNGHEDYHKAGDDWNKINYIGELAIIKYIQQVIAGTGTMGKLAFAKTKDTDIAPASLPVTLGILPDYAFRGTGVRIDGVSKGRLAESIGLQVGDILSQLGDQQFTDVTSYMQALRTFKKGDKTVLHFQRGTTEKTVALQF